MKRLFIVLAAAVAVGCSGGDTEEKKEESGVETNRPRVVMETDMGTIVLELFPDIAPNHVKNFLDLVDKGFYDGLTFHRVVKGMVIQSGSPDGSPGGHAGYTIPAEFSNVPHMPGTLGMARGVDPNSASSQFYICLSQLPDLDGQYTVFGQVVDGMNTVQEIGKVETVENEVTKEKSEPASPVGLIRAYREGQAS